MSPDAKQVISLSPVRHGGVACNRIVAYPADLKTKAASSSAIGRDEPGGRWVMASGIGGLRRAQMGNTLVG
jgi:hypothetical protein